MVTIHYVKRWFFELHNIPIPGIKEKPTDLGAADTMEPPNKQPFGNATKIIQSAALAQPAIAVSRRAAQQPAPSITSRLQQERQEQHKTIKRQRKTITTERWAADTMEPPNKQPFGNGTKIIRSAALAQPAIAS